MSSAADPSGAPPDPLKAAWQQHLRGREAGAAAAAVWVPDTASISCMHCSKAFGMLRRRHHCRRCGALVCGDCSDGRVSARLIKADARMQILASEHGERLRICTKCTKVIDFRITKTLQDRGFRRGNAAVGTGSPPGQAGGSGGGGEYESFSSMMRAEQSPSSTKEGASGRTNPNPLSRQNPEDEASRSPEAAPVDPEVEARKEAQRQKFRDERAAMMRRLKGGEDSKAAEAAGPAEPAGQASEEASPPSAASLTEEAEASPREESVDWDDGDIASI